MQFYFFHLMPWPYLPDDFDQQYDSAWVWLPNSLYDPAKGHDLYREYINTLAYADELGFDGICVNEHHQNAYGPMPSPNVIAGALTQRTAEGDAALAHVVSGNLDGDDVAGQDADEVFPHFPRNVCDDLVSIVKPNAELSVGQ